MKWILICLLLHAGSIYGQNDPNNYRVGSGDGFYRMIKHQFGKIDSARLVLHEPDTTEAESEKIFSIIKANRDIIVNIGNTFDYNLLDIARSEDSALYMVSWDTRLGGTEIDYASVVLYRADNKIFYKRLGDTDGNGDIDNPKIYYTKIYTYKQGNWVTYVAQGFGQGSTALPWQQAQAFVIDDTTLSSPAIFPKIQNKLFVEFDTHAFRRTQKIPTIKFDEQKLTIKVPVAESNGGFNGEYYTLKLLKSKFVIVR